MSRNVFLVIALNILFFLNGLGQSSICGTEQRHRWMMQHDPQYQNEFLSIQREIKARIPLISNSAYRNTISKVPVVVHIIHLGEQVGTGSNISDQQVNEAVNGLNDRWRNYIGNGVDMTIEFCLARTDPNGNATNGIVRVNGSGVPDYAQYGIESGTYSGADDTDIKDLSRWPRADYYNIWVVHQINGPTAGYAYYPTTYTYEGTVAEANSMTYNSKLLAHELGHAFNLPHTFEGDNNGNSCPANNNCATEGDQICDTPPHTRNDCGSSNPCTTSGVWDNSRRNYMSYCNSTNRFTADQQIRALAATTSSARYTLINNNNVCACASVSDCDDNNPCTVDACVGGSCSNIPAINCVLASFPACEDFEYFAQCDADCGEACQLTNGWENIGTDDIDWTSDAGGTPSSNTGPEADHTLGTGSGRYLYTEASSGCNPANNAIITSPAYDLIQVTNASIGFWYHMYGDHVGDLSLQIESPQGSANWNTLFSISGNQGDAWQYEQVDLSAYTGNIVRFRFVGQTGLGFRSDIAIDDICVDASTISCTDIIVSKDTSLCQGNGLVINGNYINAPGTYYDTLARITGCDSIIALTVDFLSNYTLSLDAGWNMISSFVYPAQSDILDIFSPISSDVVIVKNIAGESAIPSLGINTIGEWDIETGYKVNSKNNTSFTIGCEQVNPANTPIHLTEGWSMIAYVRSSSMNVVTALSSLNSSDIVIVKDIHGASYVPGFGINTIGDMLPGQGYIIKMNNPATLYYPSNQKNSSAAYYQTYQHPAYYHHLKNTGHNATIIIPDESIEGLEAGDEIAVFDQNGMPAGAAVYKGRHLAITVWGDDALTDDIKEGLAENETYTYKAWRSEDQKEYNLEVTYTEGGANYTHNGISVLKTAKPEGYADDLGLKMYPNPTTGRLNIEFTLADNEEVSISVYNIYGKEVIKEVQQLGQGRNTTTLDLGQIAAGFYLCEFRSANRTKTVKIEKL